MKILQLRLLGTPQILIDNQPLTGFATNKAKALLFYLAVTAHTDMAQPQPHTRDALATLLWSELADTQAKQNLRSVLPDLRRLIGDHVQVERQSVTFDHTRPYWLDVEVLRRSLKPSPSSIDLDVRQAAIDLYQGEFLHGFYVQNAPLFEAWVVEQREQLHILVVNALTTLVGEYAQRGNATAALAANRRLLSLEPWSEPAHRQQMRLLTLSGDRAAALAQYETCRRMLADEFGIAPLPETTALYEQIRTEKGGREDTETRRQQNQSQEDQVIDRQAAVASPETNGQSLVEPIGRGRQTANTRLAIPMVGHNLPKRTRMYGRQAELASLHKWLVEDGCHLVGIFGIGGQGKTTLVATLVRELAEAAVPPAQPEGRIDAASARSTIGVGPVGFTRIIWQSLLNAPPLAEVLQEWVYVLSDQMVTSLPSNVDQQFAHLLDYLRRQRCLLILDNLESILQGDEHSGYFRPGYEPYGQLLRRLAEGEHRSCLLLTSRERPLDMTHLEEETPAVRSLTLAGLPAEAGRQLLQGCGLDDNRGDLGALVQHYSGNPLALKLAAETVHGIFDGNISAFLQAEALVFDDIRHVLDQQFSRLAPLEREVVLWLALLREPVPFPALRDLLAQPPAPRLVLEAVRSLQRRSLLEKFDEGFGLQNVVLEYATDRLIETIGRELVSDQVTPTQDVRRRLGDKGTALPDTNEPLSHLSAYPLMLAQGKEYVRASQTRLLLQPVVEQLVDRLGRTGAEQQLQRLLVQVRTASPLPGYAAANLLHLLLHLGVDLRGVDFSRLYLRQAYLRGVSLPQTNFAGAQFVDSVFTEPFGLVYTVAFSPDGAYVAAGTSEGAIYLWRTADQQLAHVIGAHPHAIRQVSVAQWGPAGSLAEGERYLALASASDDKRVGFWALTPQGQLRRHVQLAHPQQEAVVAVGLHPDGQRVTSVDIDGHVFVWKVGEHHEPQLVHHFATAFTRIRLVAFSRDGQTVVIGHRDGAVRFWQATTGETRLRLTSTTGLIFTLALSQDGQLLATGGREGHLALWRLPNGELHQVMGQRPHCVIATTAGAIRALAFSPDGKWLASGHEDLAVRLWVIDAQGYLQLQRTLLGHTQTIWSVAFGPAPTAQPAARPETQGSGNRDTARQLLVTGSSDQTVRVWDAETGHTLYMLRGQPRVLAAHTIRQLPPAQPANSPVTPQETGWLLAAAGYDGLIHLWQGQGNAADSDHRVLHGAHGPLYAVGISPDGRSVVAGGYDTAIYVWDRASGQLRQTFHGHTNCVYALVFHPDGELLASGSGDGTIRLWVLPEVESGPGRGADVALSAQPVAILQADLDVVHDLAFSPDGRLLARGGSDRLLRLWDMTQPHYPELVDERRVVQDESEEDIFGVAFSPDGSKVACSGNHLVHLVDLSTGEALLILRRHTAWIAGVAFSPDGKILASSSADCTVCLWDVTTGALRAVLRGHREIVYRVAFTLDGTAVISSSFDGTLKFWDLQSGECLNTLVVEGPYAGMNITGVTEITSAQKAALKTLGAVEE